MTDELESNVTIAELVPSLTDPIEYVRVVLGNMQACRHEHGNASVRVGITGRGKMPYHKVTYQAEGNEQLYGAFDGTSAFLKVEIHENTWSTKTMTFEEVRDLIGTLRGWKRKKRQPNSTIV